MRQPRWRSSISRRQPAGDRPRAGRPWRWRSDGAGRRHGGPEGESAEGAGARGRAVPARRFRPADREALAVLLSVHGLGPLTLARLVERRGSPAAILELAADRARRPGSSTPVAAATAGGRAMPRTSRRRSSPDAREAILADVARSASRRRARRSRVPVATPRDRGAAAGAVRPRQHSQRSSRAARRRRRRHATARARGGADRQPDRDGAAVRVPTVVSGLAIGIDGAAHAAVRHGAGPTVAFIGGGHARLFPRAHDRLADAIVDAGGAIVSEYAPQRSSRPRARSRSETG